MWKALEIVLDHQTQTVSLALGGIHIGTRTVQILYSQTAVVGSLIKYISEDVGAAFVFTLGIVAVILIDANG